MRARKIIRKHILNSWQRCIAEDYANQRINSERSLQASLWAALRDRIGNNRRLFIEPSLSFIIKGRRKILYPDIVICNTRQVIAVIELKYMPNSCPNLAKDLRSLSSISENRNSIVVSNRRHRGPKADDREYGCSKNILFVWAGVHRGGKCGMERAKLNVSCLAGCLLELHATTREFEQPLVFCCE